MRAVRYHLDARSEFLDQVQYYISISDRLADRYHAAVTEAEQHAAPSSDAWPKHKHRTRRIVDRTFKFSLVYLHNESEVYIVAVAPTRRKPGYWRARLSDA